MIGIGKGTWIKQKKWCSSLFSIIVITNYDQRNLGRKGFRLTACKSIIKGSQDRDSKEGTCSQKP